MTRIPYHSGVFQQKIDFWVALAGAGGRAFSIHHREANWKIERLFLCEHCEEHAVITGRKKARCPGCRKPMLEHANYVVPYD